MEKSNYFNGLTRYWFLPLLTGLIFIGFGVWCLVDPAPSLKILAYIFAGAIGAIGVFNLFYGICNFDTYHGWGYATAAGIVEILFCIFLFFIPSPLLTWIFVYGIGLYVIFTAIYSFFDSFMMVRQSWAWIFGLLLLLGATIAFALIFMLEPGIVQMTGWIWIGISFLCYGVYRVLIACKLRQINQENS